MILTASKVIHYDLADSISMNWCGLRYSPLFINMFALEDGILTLTPKDAPFLFSSNRSKTTVLRVICGRLWIRIALDGSFEFGEIEAISALKETRVQQIVDMIKIKCASFFEKTQRYFDQWAYLAASIVRTTPENAIATLTRFGWGLVSEHERQPVLITLDSEASDLFI